MTVITLNDIAAFYVGFFFGRTPLIKVENQDLQLNNYGLHRYHKKRLMIELTIKALRTSFFRFNEHFQLFHEIISIPSRDMEHLFPQPQTLISALSSSSWAPRRPWRVSWEAAWSHWRWAPSSPCRWSRRTWPARWRSLATGHRCSPSTSGARCTPSLWRRTSRWVWRPIMRWLCMITGKTLYPLSNQVTQFVINLHANWNTVWLFQLSVHDQVTKFPI